uniref:DUF4298 domain-containing protein n=2 Tax=unclassified Prevotella TaxID=2638335 RepID=A0AB33JIS1_9BACT
MEKYRHITEMENILDSHSRKMQELNELLESLKSSKEDYDRLMEYYYSDRRNQDLEDDRNGLIDKNLKRGVLSEDAIYDLMADNYQCCMKMLELAVDYLKRE